VLEVTYSNSSNRCKFRKIVQNMREWTNSYPVCHGEVTPMWLPGQIVCADHLYCTVHNWEDHNFESKYHTLFHAFCHFVTQNLCTHVRQYIALLFYIILLSEQKRVAGIQLQTVRYIA
jgi:hypothetical protein